MTDIIDSTLSAVRGMDPTARTLIAMLGMFLETSVLVGVVVPGDTIVLIASTGVTSAPQFLWLVVALVVGALMGESVGFALGRVFGPKLRQSWLGRKIGERNWLLADLYLGDRGGIAIFVSRFLPILHSLIPLTAGMTRMRYRTFFAWTAPACILWATLYVSVGVFAALSYDQLVGTIKGAGYVIIAIIALFLFLMWLLKRKLMRLELAAHEVDLAGDKNNPNADDTKSTSSE